MHTCPVPGALVDNWLTAFPSSVGNYGHLLLEQSAKNDTDLVEGFRPYFESAHLDARQYFHECMSIDLHPDASSPGAHAMYPDCLPSTTLRGLFGEVMAGMLSEHFEFVGEHKWQVPVFLFRFHSDVEAYLFKLARDSSQTRALFGRFGSDFLALAFSDDGKIERYLVGEAKWRKDLHQSVVDNLLLGKVDPKSKKHDGRGIWNQLNLDVHIPHGMRQLQRLLKDYSSTDFSAAISSIDQAILLSSDAVIPRTNLVLLCGNGGKARKPGESLVDWSKKPVEYTSAHDLQVVEVILEDGEKLIESIYQSLWKDK